MPLVTGRRVCSVLPSAGGRALEAEATVTTEAVLTTVRAGRVEYGAIRQRESPALTVAWRYRISRAGRWFTCGELVPEGSTFAVRGWDGLPIGQAGNVRDGLEVVRHYYATMAIGSAVPAQSLRY